jgi:hypothetical protein
MDIDDCEYKSQDDLITKLLAKVKYYESALEALHVAMRAAADHQGNTIHADALEKAIYERLHRAYSDVFMFGNIFGGKLQKKATKIAQDKFLHDCMGVMEYLQTDGRYGTHLSSDESELRADIKEQLIKKKIMLPVVARTACPECNASRGRDCRNTKYKRVAPHAARNRKALKEAVHPKD